jgi:hypothetical protein
MQIRTVFRQRGAALFTALIMMIALTLVALASLGTSLLELRMSGSEESAMSAYQSAQAGVDVIVNDALSDQQFVVARGGRGTTNCYNVSGCTYTILSSAMPPPVNTAFSKIKITQVVEQGVPPRIGRFATSARLFSAAYFEVESTYDKSSAGQGKAAVAHGYLQLLPGSLNTNIPPAPQESN